MEADVLVEWMHMIEMEAWDKKENTIISNFPLNLNIMPKLVLICTEKTLSFDKCLFSHFLSDVGSLCLHWPKGFSYNPTKTKGILLEKIFLFFYFFF